MTKTIRAGEGEYAGLDNRALQRAVNHLSAEGGGVLEVPAGTYQFHDALHLRDNVDIVGEEGTIFKKVPSVTSKLTLFVGYGHYEFAVSEPEKFSPGMGVLVQDDNAGGFYTTAATIVAERAGLFYIDQPFSHDYLSGANATVTSVFSLVRGIGIRNAELRHVVLDGSWPEETAPMNGCRGGGVFLLDCHSVVLRRLEVRHYHGDAVSFQQCTDIGVMGSYLHDNSGGGLHPGSGSVRYRMSLNRIENNGGNGIFYCLRTTHSICMDNNIAGNGEDGISVGERDTDHAIRYNVIEGNKGAGIHMRTPHAQSGDRVLLEGNRLTGNNTGGQSAEIYIAGGLRNVAVLRNRIDNEKGPAIYVELGSSHLYIAENSVNGRDQVQADVAGDHSSVTFEEPQEFPPVGPMAADSNSVLHLNIAKLDEPGPYLRSGQ